MSKVLPLGQNVLVRPVTLEKTTESGIVLPETASEEKPQEGVIVAIGESEKINERLKEGTKVIFKKYSGNEIEIEKEEHVILDAKDDILAIIED